MSKLGAVPPWEETLRQTERSWRVRAWIAGSVPLALAAWSAIAHTFPLSTTLFLASMGLVHIALFGRRSLPILDRKEREELEKRAHTDLHAAKQLRKLLKQDLKGEALMKRNLDKMAPPEMMASALAMIEQREKELHARLLEAEATIQQLRA
jgi:hypothetical protein